MLERAPPGFISPLDAHVRRTRAFVDLLKAAKEGWERSKTYHMGLNVQLAQRDLDNHIAECRARIKLVHSV